MLVAVTCGDYSNARACNTLTATDRYGRQYSSDNITRLNRPEVSERMHRRGIRIHTHSRQTSSDSAWAKEYTDAAGTNRTDANRYRRQAASCCNGTAACVLAAVMAPALIADAINVPDLVVVLYSQRRCSQKLQMHWCARVNACCG
jgi:hypothetical protein